MIDVNNYAEVTRNAPESNIPVYNILETTYILGGASNVAKILKNLEANVEIVSVVGDDIYGTKILETFNEKNIKYKLFIDKERKTTQKNRIFEKNKLNVRFDIESTNDIPNNIEQEIIDYIINRNTSQNKIDAIVISDYDKGVVTENLSQQIISYANKNNIPTFVDPKIKNYLKYKNCFLFKPNKNEGEIISGEKDINNIFNIIKEKINCNNILLTMGEDGMILNNIYKINNYSEVNLVDVTGSGDIVLAVLVYVYLRDKDLLKASKISNYIARKSVSVIGNYNVTLNDINENYDLFINMETKKKIIYDYEYNKIKQISNNYKNIIFTNGCFDILHSAHIELLQFSKKQGDILVVGLNSDDSIKHLKGESRPINDIHERTKILSLFDFVDYIIIFNDYTPLNIIKILKPNIMVKGSDYNKENIVGKEYVNNIILFDFIQNKSSTNVINKIKLIK